MLTVFTRSLLLIISFIQLSYFYTVSPGLSAFTKEKQLVRVGVGLKRTYVHCH